MAAPRRRTSAELQVNGGLMPPSAHMIASTRGGGGGGAPSREEHAVTANGGGPPHRGAKQRGGSSVCSANKVSGRRRPAGRMPLWRVFIFASVALNVAALPLLLHQYIVNQPHHPGVLSPDQQHHACAPQPGTSGAAARAPSTGKPSVTSDSVINLDHGDPTMFEAFWRETGDAAELVIPGWQTMSYFSDVSNVCWFMEPLFDQQVRRLHRTVGNAAVDGYHVLVGTGSTQLFMAALYALSPADADQPTSVISTAPYYSDYKHTPSGKRKNNTAVRYIYDGQHQTTHTLRKLKIIKRERSRRCRGPQNAAPGTISHWLGGERGRHQLGICHHHASTGPSTAHPVRHL